MKISIKDNSITFGNVLMGDIFATRNNELFVKTVIGGQEKAISIRNGSIHNVAKFTEVRVAKALEVIF